MGPRRKVNNDDSHSRCTPQGLSLGARPGSDLERCLELAGHTKADRSLGGTRRRRCARRRHVAMLFDKPSLRTRSRSKSASAARATWSSCSRCRWAAGLWLTSPGTSSVGRHRRHQDDVTADAAGIRRCAPRLRRQRADQRRASCQAVADFALRERWGSLRGRTIAPWRRNNVAASLAHTAAMPAYLHRS